MLWYKNIALLAAIFASVPASAAGLKLLKVPADASGPAITVSVWYPSPDRPSPVAFGPFTASAAQDGILNGNGLPLVVLSHGRGGSFAVHHDTAEYLADVGFVVAALNHPGDTALDKSRFDDVSVFATRPLDVKRVIDYMIGPSPVAAAIDRNRIGIYGYSRGGYAALVAIGANPDFALALPLCEGRTDKMCEQARAHEYSDGLLTHDSRIKAAAVADPLAIFFTADNLAGITVPVQIWGSEKGGDGVEPKTVEALDAALKGPHTFIKVENSQHFSFLTVCPARFADLEPGICKDPHGFDRVLFHAKLNEDLARFFRAHL
jgi:predicted dienelactone hydrolase